MIRKIINLDNYVCSRSKWMTALFYSSSGVDQWVEIRDANPRLWRWINPPLIDPLRYFFRIDAGKKGWKWSADLEECYAFLISYYINPNLIILSADEPGGRVEMINEDASPQPETSGLIPVNWNIPLLAEFDKALTGIIESLGLGIPTWLVYALVGTYVYTKFK
ncbi:MAG: hypothetical protein IH950_16340 [Bacteroidetes bacterium]|nr:hypothetical protein [Bacteroidota bacterium]